jgi:hypothetical protein
MLTGNQGAGKVTAYQIKQRKRFMLQVFHDGASQKKFSVRLELSLILSHTSGFFFKYQQRQHFKEV